MKKLSMILVCILALATAGCGTSSAPSTDAASSGTSEASSSTGSAPAADATGEDVTISLLSWNNEELMRPYIQGFEAENPGIKIDLQFVPPVQQYVDKFMVLASTSQVTDMFYTAAENKQEIIEKGLAEDLSAMPIFQRIAPNTAATYGADGKIYAYAPDAWVGGVFYNKELFAQAGITETPKTWADFVDALAKTKALGIEPFVSGADNVHEMAQSLYMSMVISQDPLVDQKINKGETTFVDNYTKPFSLWYTDVYAAGLSSQISLGINPDQAVDMFVTGQSAMYHGGPWNINTFVQKNPDLQFDMFPIPDPDGNAVLNGAVSPGLSISSSSPNKEASQKFLNYISTDENIVNWQKTTGNVLIVEGIDYTIDTVIDQFKDDAVKGNFYLPQIVWNNSAGIYKEMLVGIQDAMTGSDSIENVPVRMDKKMAELTA